MKARYILLICILTLLVNVTSVYNVYFGLCSLFLCLLVFIPQLFSKLVNKANRVEEDKRNIMERNFANYGTLKTTQLTNKFAIIFSMIVIYGMAVLFTLLQIKNRNQFSSFISSHFQVPYIDQITQILSMLGYFLIAISLVLAAIHVIRLMKNEQMFIGK